MILINREAIPYYSIFNYQKDCNVKIDPFRFIFHKARRRFLPLSFIGWSVGTYKKHREAIP